MLPVTRIGDPAQLAAADLAARTQLATYLDAVDQLACGVRDRRPFTVHGLVLDCERSYRIASEWLTARSVQHERMRAALAGGDGSGMQIQASLSEVAFTNLSYRLLSAATRAA